jgi:hypothetical protein
VCTFENFGKTLPDFTQVTYTCCHQVHAINIDATKNSKVKAISYLLFQKAFGECHNITG